jgi:hypothetical protein
MSNVDLNANAPVSMVKVAVLSVLGIAAAILTSVLILLLSH